MSFSSASRISEIRPRPDSLDSMPDEIAQHDLEITNLADHENEDQASTRMKRIIEESPIVNAVLTADEARLMTRLKEVQCGLAATQDGQGQARGALEDEVKLAELDAVAAKVLAVVRDVQDGRPEVAAKMSFTLGDCFYRTGKHVHANADGAKALFAKAIALMEEFKTISQEIGDKVAVAMACSYLARFYHRSGDVKEAAQREEALAIAEDIGDPKWAGEVRKARGKTSCSSMGPMLSSEAAHTAFHSSHKTSQSTSARRKNAVGFAVTYLRRLLRTSAESAGAADVADAAGSTALAGLMIDAKGQECQQQMGIHAQDERCRPSTPPQPKSGGRVRTRPRMSLVLHACRGAHAHVRYDTYFMRLYLRALTDWCSRRFLPATSREAQQPITKSIAHWCR